MRAGELNLRHSQVPLQLLLESSVRDKAVLGLSGVSRTCRRLFSRRKSERPPEGSAERGTDPRWVTEGCCCPGPVKW